MKYKGKVLGVMVRVEGNESEVAMYIMSNNAYFLWYGDILVGPRVGALLTIYQNKELLKMISLRLQINMFL